MAEIRVTPNNPQLAKDLSTIAGDMGVPRSSYILMKLKEIVDVYKEKKPHIFKK